MVQLSIELRVTISHTDIEATTHGFRGLITLNERSALTVTVPHSLTLMVGEPVAYATGLPPKGHRGRLVRFINSPITKDQV